MHGAKVKSFYLSYLPVFLLLSLQCFCCCPYSVSVAVLTVFQLNLVALRVDVAGIWV